MLKLFMLCKHSNDVGVVLLSGVICKSIVGFCLDAFIVRLQASKVYVGNLMLSVATVKTLCTGGKNKRTNKILNKFQN